MRNQNMGATNGSPSNEPAKKSTLPDRSAIKSAVALKYDGQVAPRVTAKGRGEVASSIIETACQHGVPVENNAELNELLSTVDLGEEIPTELYVAVAEVLCFAYRVREEQQDNPAAQCFSGLPRPAYE